MIQNIANEVPKYNTLELNDGIKILGMDKTIQRADKKPFGVMYRLCPETTEEQMNILACFAQNGTEDAPVSTQTVLPDLSNFEVIYTLMIL